MQRSGSSPSRLYCSSLFCECPKFCDLAKQRRKIFGGVSEVGRDDFSLYFCWRCVVFLVLYYSSAAIARHNQLFYQLFYRRVQNKAQNSYICTFEDINVDYSDTFGHSCDFKLMKFVPCAT